MSNRFLVGTDYTVEDINQYLPYQKDSIIVFFLGANFDGNRSLTTQQTTFNTFDYAGNVHFNVRPQLESKSTLGVQYYTNQQTSLFASGTHFPSPGLSSITATGTKQAPTSNLIANSCWPKAPNVLFATRLDVGDCFVPVAVIDERPGLGKCVPDAASVVSWFV